MVRVRGGGWFGWLGMGLRLCPHKHSNVSLCVYVFLKHLLDNYELLSPNQWHWLYLIVQAVFYCNCFDLILLRLHTFVLLIIILSEYCLHAHKHKWKSWKRAGPITVCISKPQITLCSTSIKDRPFCFHSCTYEPLKYISCGASCTLFSPAWSLIC